ncbi:MAG: hypothetical protein RSC52_03205 [Oscillospiraceae bacterium]
MKTVYGFSGVLSPFEVDGCCHGGAERRKECGFARCAGVIEFFGKACNNSRPFIGGYEGEILS